MLCPYCKNNNSEVMSEEVFQHSIRRIRLCSSCLLSFPTYENVHAFPLTVLKRNREREPFYINKIRKSLVIALGKRQMSSTELDKLVHNIERLVRKGSVGDIETEHIYQICADALYKVDKVGFIRYIADRQVYHNNFRDIYPESIVHILKDQQIPLPLEIKK